MSDAEIQFGDVEETPPQTRRRPDRDRHFAVVDYGRPAGGELPIFVDVDVLADIEAHAQSDTSVELGGVLLGGQHLDEEGEPFVLVSDSLRAEHYESSQGHFKFTHDTWTEIGRQREEFSDDLQMVGWYHTHPGWGVFLSGMDRFICDHFFNRALDVALVVDPVGGDRGWFIWRHDGGERLPRVAGFHITASRFRQRELTAYAAQLEGKTTMTPRTTPGEVPGLVSQVLHTVRPQLGWIGAALLAVLLLQAGLTLLIALRLEHADPDATQAEGAAAGHDYEKRIASLEERLRAVSEIERRGQRLDAQQTLFNQLLGRVKVSPDGNVDVASLVEENARQAAEIERLARSEFLLDELAENHTGLQAEQDRLLKRIASLQEAQAELESSKETLRGQLRQAAESRDEARSEARTARAKLARLEAGEDADDADDEPDDEEGGFFSAWTIGLILLAVAAVVAVLATVVVVRRRRPGEPKPDEPPGDEP